MLLLLAVAGTCTPPQPAPVRLVDAAAMRSYVCPVGDSGAAWTCQDGITTEAGTCARMGCAPVSEGGTP